MGLVIIIILLSLGILIFLWSFIDPSAKKYYDKLNKNLKDDLLYDSVSGVKMTLEEATTGQWEGKSDDFITKGFSKSYIQSLYTNESKSGHLLINYLIKSNNYNPYTFSLEELTFLDRTIILSKYDYWEPSFSFIMENQNGFVLLPSVTYFANEHEDYYEETQLMFWLKVNFNMGHYFFKKKNALDAFLDMFLFNKVLKLKNYSYTELEKAKKTWKIEKLIKEIEENKTLEIECIGNNFLVKNSKFIDLNEFRELENKINAFAKIISL